MSTFRGKGNPNQRISKDLFMNKLLAALVAGLFAAGAFAQQAEPTTAAPAAAKVAKHASAKKHVAAKKHKVRHVAKAHTATAKKV
jgi:outer membrane lipoprotein-sorting protein